MATPPPLPQDGQKRWADVLNNYLTWLGNNGTTADAQGDYSYPGIIYDAKNLAGAFPATTKGTAALATNFSNGSNEVDFFNTNSAAAGVSSFQFYQMTGASTANQVLNLVGWSNAVNQMKIANSTTGAAPTITSTGSDANVGLQLQTKGTGWLTIAQNALGPYRALTGSSTSSSDSSLSSLITSGVSNTGTLGGTFNYVNIGGFKVLWGSGTSGSVAATNGASGLTVTFPASFFSTTPYGITTTTNSSSSDWRVQSSAQSVATTGFTLVFSNSGASASNISANYLIIGT